MESLASFLGEEPKDLIGTIVDAVDGIHSLNGLNGVVVDKGEVVGIISPGRPLGSAQLPDSIQRLLNVRLAEVQTIKATAKEE